MVDSSSVDLVAEMNGKRKKMRIWPFIATLGAIFTFIAFKNSEPTFRTYFEWIFELNINPLNCHKTLIPSHIS